MKIFSKIDISTKHLNELIKFCIPRGCKIKELHIRTSKNKSYAWYGYYAPDSKIIRIGIGKESWFPMIVDRVDKDVKEGYKTDFLLSSRDECLVYVLSHELRHLWQGQNKKAPRKGKIKSTYSESDADIYALYKLRQWRRKKEKAALELLKLQYLMLEQTY